jgi:predicted transcriptional regulator
MLRKMEFLNPTTQKIMATLLRQLAAPPTIAMLAETLNITHVGAWKAIKKLQEAQFITIESAGTKKNSTYMAYLNWDNPLVKKMLALMLEHEARQQRRWIVNFAELEKKVDFLILYGSILHLPKEANDIDIIGVVSNNKNFSDINKIILKIQSTQLKKIHVINFTPQEFKAELKKQNKAFIDAIKKGVVLFGQNKFVKFVKELSQ